MEKYKIKKTKPLLSVISDDIKLNNFIKKGNLKSRPKKILKVGLIGLGEQSWDNLLPSLVLNQGVVIDSVCDIDTQKLNLTKSKYKVKTYVSFKEMINSRQLDCVIVASSPQVHFEITKLALDKNIPVFIEKPPVVNYSQIKELSEHPNFHKLTNGVGINFNYAESLIKINELFKKENFGKLRYLNISHIANKPDKPLWGLKCLSDYFYWHKQFTHWHLSLVLALHIL